MKSLWFGDMNGSANRLYDEKSERRVQMKYVCSICGYVYDETENMPWADLPANWKCPLCGAAKSDFAPEGKKQSPADVSPPSREKAELKPLTAIETSALCTNLAKGCEKQYQPEQGKLCLSRFLRKKGCQWQFYQ